MVVNDIGVSENGTKFADMVVEEIRAMGKRAVPNYGSVGSLDGGAAIIKTCVGYFGKIDVLVT